MAILHRASLTPSKPELLAAWLPTVDAFAVAEGPIEHLGAYRFDDPDGEVGIESHLVRVADGRTLHLPVTYRNDPLPGADAWKVGTLEHSVLGTRHVYDAVADPVFVAELARVIVQGGQQAPLMIATDNGPVERENTVFVTGTGDGRDDVGASIVSIGRSGVRTVITLPAHVLAVHHEPRPDDAAVPLRLTGTWPGQPTPMLLAERTTRP